MLIDAFDILPGAAGAIAIPSASTDVAFGMPAVPPTSACNYGGDNCAPKLMVTDCAFVNDNNSIKDENVCKSKVTDIVYILCIFLLKAVHGRNSIRIHFVCRCAVSQHKAIPVMVITEPSNPVDGNKLKIYTLYYYFLSTFGHDNYLLY